VTRTKNSPIANARLLLDISIFLARRMFDRIAANPEPRRNKKADVLRSSLDLSTSAYSSTGRPSVPGCPLFRHPKKRVAAALENSTSIFHATAPT
jgi:hypothetical protein